MFHAGDADTGRTLARRNLEIFEGLGVDAIVNNSAGGGCVMKEVAQLMPGVARAAWVSWQGRPGANS